VQRSAALGEFLVDKLRDELSSMSSKLKFDVRGLGLMAGVELRDKEGCPATDASLSAIKALLHDGYILLPEGEHANVISFTPPLTISRGQLSATARALKKVLNRE
jgi:4-aminobutyrate aminotransferase-like enzyme